MQVFEAVDVDVSRSVMECSETMDVRAEGLCWIVKYGML